MMPNCFTTWFCNSLCANSYNLLLLFEGNLIRREPCRNSHSLKDVFVEQLHNSGATKAVPFWRILQCNWQIPHCDGCNGHILCGPVYSKIHCVPVTIVCFWKWTWWTKQRQQLRSLTAPATFMGDGLRGMQPLNWDTPVYNHSCISQVQLLQLLQIGNI